MTYFPDIADDDSFWKIFREEERWRPGIEALLEQAGIRYTTLDRILDGSNLVYALDQDRILKVCPDISRVDAEVEFDLLARFERANLSISSPRLLEVGEFEGWPWAVISRLEGVSGRDAWEKLEASDKRHAIAQIGEWMKESWESSDVQSATLPPRRGDWEAAQVRFREGLISKHRKREVSEEHLAQIEEIMSDWEPRFDTTLVHADIHWGNLLFSDASGRWEVSGILDFADALVTPSIYDLCAPLATLVGGDKALTKVLYRHTIGADHELDARTMFQWMLMHRFFHIPYTLGVFGMKDEQGVDMMTVARRVTGLE